MASTTAPANAYICPSPSVCNVTWHWSQESCMASKQGAGRSSALAGVSGLPDDSDDVAEVLDKDEAAEVASELFGETMAERHSLNELVALQCDDNYMNALERWDMYRIQNEDIPYSVDAVQSKAREGMEWFAKVGGKDLDDEDTQDMITAGFDHWAADPSQSEAYKVALRIQDKVGDPSGVGEFLTRRQMGESTTNDMMGTEDGGWMGSHATHIPAERVKSFRNLIKESKAEGVLPNYRSTVSKTYGGDICTVTLPPEVNELPPREKALVKAVITNSLNEIHQPLSWNRSVSQVDLFDYGPSLSMRWN